MRVIKNRSIRTYIMGALAWLVFFAFLIFVIYFFMFILELNDNISSSEKLLFYRALSHQIGGEG